MTLSAHALTTWATIAPELGLATNDSRQSVVERMINAVSAALETAALGRHFEFQAGIVELVKGFGGPRIVLERNPVKQISMVQLLNIDGTLAVTYDPLSYTLENPGAGFVYSGGLWGSSYGMIGISGWPWTARPGDGIRSDLQAGTERMALRVVYDGGWYTSAQAAAYGATSEVPADLEEACIVGVTEMFRRRSANRDVSSESLFGSSQVTYREPDVLDGGLPKECLAVARRYARLI